MLTFCSDNKNAVIVPDSEELAKALCACDGQLEMVKRYHTCPPENGFDVDRLRETVSRAQNMGQFRLSMIDEEFYKKSFNRAVVGVLCVQFQRLCGLFSPWLWLCAH